MLRFRGQSVALPDTEFRLASALLEREGAVVSRDRLRRSGTGGQISPNTLDVQIGRLRRRVADIDLNIRTVRGRGYLLEAV